MAKANLEEIRHSAAHVLAQAVKKLYPKVKLGIGPTIDTGFYYDFDNLKLEMKDLAAIEAEMKKIIKKNLAFKKEKITKSAARKLFKNEPYKLELINELKDKDATIYRTGKEFVDLCAGPHVRYTKEIKAFKLTNLASAYWKGDAKNPMLTRIYGTAFPSKAALDEHLKLLEEAEKRDNAKLGPQLDLYHINPLIGKGLPLFHPKGTVIRKEITKLVDEINKELECEEVFTPHIAKSDLWHASGHYEAYKDEMFIFKVDKQEFAVRPMNCPFHSQIYKSKHKSYKDLPVRMVEMGTVYRNEISGALHGLSRVRCISMDDGHFFVRKDQIEQESAKLVKAILKIWKDIFGMKPTIILATRPEKSIGDKKTWDHAEKELEKVLKKLKVKYELKEKDGAFYGPKIDVNVYDALGREWSVGTVQLDFFMPERFGLWYAGEDNQKHRPTMIHRAMASALERCIGMLIEHYAGEFPLWLAPVQVKVIGFTERNEKYAKQIEKKLRDAGLRVEGDYRSESVQYKVREAELEKIKYIIVAGDKEQKGKTIALRTRGQKKLQFGMKLDAFIKKAKAEAESRALK